MTSDTLFAILTGDLIGSTRASQKRVEHTMNLLSGGLPPGIRWDGWTAANVRFTRHRGDGWQMLAPEPDLALRWAVTLLAGLRADPQALGTRISIGIGTITSRGTEDLRDASGPVFEASGRGLDAMRRDETLFMMGGETGHSASETPRLAGAVKASVMLIDERIARWSPEQAEATAYFLHPSAPPATEIARRLSITPQAVSYRLKGAGARTLKDALSALEHDWRETWSRPE
ncbi:hypothetical protein QKW60_00815 [Defluviimonas aestuarii]|uniref:hypothetical protein n=1 Tax=Albidovulum aestuarii TaxID=1130726 RepID=UPI00249A0CFE|nr:hypothetical protein [Defluviimonas aestuarii]MDI3334938.1 hypothetical protein [Defluviimonas aestuarii]